MKFAALHHTTISSLKKHSSRSVIITGYPRNFDRKDASFPNHEPYVVKSRRNLASSSSVSNKDVTTTVAGTSSLPATPTLEGVGSLTVPIDFDTSSSIQGEESQILQVQLKPNQVLRAESGAMLFMTQGLEMDTSISTNNNTAGGILNEGFQRMMTGQNLFFSDFTYRGEEGTKGTVALGTDFPSKILRFSLGEYGGKIVCQKGALLASSLDVEIQMEFTKKLTAGFFGGEGFVLQGLVGNGDVFCKAGGTVIRKELREGETIRISSGCLVAFTQDVQYDVQTMPGFKNVLFGGEGLFVTTLTGPGTIWLQGMPPDRLISEIARRIPSGGIGMGIPIGLMGGGGGSGSDADGSGDDVSEPTDSAADNSAASTDEDNTITSSDSMPNGGGSVDDSESPSALFGDAASAPDFDPPLDSSSASMSDMDETTSFSTEDTPSYPNDDTTSFGDDDFIRDNTAQDETSFSDDSFSKEDSFESFDSGITESDGEEGGSSGLFGQLWDFFTGDD